MVDRIIKVLALSAVTMAVLGMSSLTFAGTKQEQAKNLEPEANAITVLNDNEVIIKNQDTEDQKTSPSTASTSKVSNAGSSLTTKATETPKINSPQRQADANNTTTAAAAAVTAAVTHKSTKESMQQKEQQANQAKPMSQQEAMPPLPTTKQAGVLAPPLLASASPVLQLEMEIDKAAHYKVFSLSNPARLVFDIKNGDEKTEFDKSSFANTVIKNIRTAQHSDGTLRIVFDLKELLAFETKEMPVANNGNAENATKKLIISLFAKDKSVKK